MKSYRILDLYNKVVNSEEIDIKKIASEENVSVRTIERDIAEIKEYLHLRNDIDNCVYDKKKEKIFYRKFFKGKTHKK